MVHSSFFIHIKRLRQRVNDTIQSLLRNTKIRNRLMWSFLILTVIPLTLIGIFFFYTTYRDNEEKSIQYSKNISAQLMRNISYVFDNYIEQFESVAMDNTTVVEMFTYDSLRVHQQVEVYSRIRYNLASVVCTSKGVNAFEIRTKSGERIYCGTPVTNDAIGQSPILQMAQNNQLMVWDLGRKETGTDKGSYIILAKKMMVQFGQDVTGYAVMAIDRKYIDTICSQMGQDENMYVVITDRDGKIISHPDKSTVMKDFDAGIMENIAGMEKERGEKSERFFKTALHGEEVLVSYEILDKNGWRVISIIPYSYLMESTVNNGIFTLICILFLVLISIYVAVLVTKSIAVPVKRLLTAMDKTGLGDLDVRLEDRWTLNKDEHAQLALGFNRMTTRLQMLIDEVYRSEINKKELEFRKKEAELNALQQQINPHFLYNTLETIYWMADIKGETEIGEMVTALGNFFRKSISHGKEYVPVSDEVQNVQYYVYLQKIRFRERFEVVWEIDARILDCLIIKLILQPIIENAIVHGVESMEKGGLIVVKGYMQEEKLYFEVIDNGKGMSKKKLEEFHAYINNSQNEKEQSVGVKNVHQRIRLYHGEEYGITIFSKQNAGTRVVLCLPVQHA